MSGRKRSAAPWWVHVGMFVVAVGIVVWGTR